MQFDCCVIGAGIVGLATALKLLQGEPRLKILIVEKEMLVATQQTGHNSGVVHSGIYYRPDSLKARLCRDGSAELKQFCVEYDIALDTIGKLVVATNGVELERLSALAQRAQANGIAAERLDSQELNRMEPNIVGVGALKIGSAAITDYAAICKKMLELLVARGAEIRFGAEVIRIAERHDGVTVALASQDSAVASQLVVCAGLQSDRLARMVGLAVDIRIVPFKGEYYRLPIERSSLVRHLIYPVPDPRLPFLGVHLTRHVDGTTTVGPNAVLSLAREGYGRHGFAAADARDILSFPGFWRLAAANFRSGANEMAMSLSRRHYLKAIQKYCPSLTLDDLETYSSGIRAQAVDVNGKMIEDFTFVRSARTFHVLNAPSPAATAALPIGRMIAEATGLIPEGANAYLRASS